MTATPRTKPTSLFTTFIYNHTYCQTSTIWQTKMVPKLSINWPVFCRHPMIQLYLVDISCFNVWLVLSITFHIVQCNHCKSWCKAAQLICLKRRPAPPIKLRLHHMVAFITVSLCQLHRFDYPFPQCVKTIRFGPCEGVPYWKQIKLSCKCGRRLMATSRH